MPELEGAGGSIIPSGWREVQALDFGRIRLVAPIPFNYLFVWWWKDQAWRRRGNLGEWG